MMGLRKELTTFDGVKNGVNGVIVEFTHESKCKMMHMLVTPITIPTATKFSNFKYKIYFFSTYISDKKIISFSSYKFVTYF